MKYIFILIICIISVQGFPKQVSKEKAKKIAENWGYLKMQRIEGDIKKEYEFVDKYDTCLYIFNFNNGGFVIVSADDHTRPVLGYSTDNQIDFDRLNPMLHDWLSYYADMIKFNKKEPQDKKIKDNWIEIEEGISLKSNQATVSSIFETNNS